MRSRHVNYCHRGRALQALCLASLVSCAKAGGLDWSGTTIIILGGAIAGGVVVIAALIVAYVLWRHSKAPPTVAPNKTPDDLEAGVAAKAEPMPTWPVSAAAVTTDPYGTAQLHGQPYHQPPPYWQQQQQQQQQQQIPQQHYVQDSVQQQATVVQPFGLDPVVEEERTPYSTTDMLRVEDFGEDEMAEAEGSGTHEKKKKKKKKGSKKKRRESAEVEEPA